MTRGERTSKEKESGSWIKKRDGSMFCVCVQRSEKGQLRMAGKTDCTTKHQFIFVSLILPPPVVVRSLPKKETRDKESESLKERV